MRGNDSGQLRYHKEAEQKAHNGVHRPNRDYKKQAFVYFGCLPSDVLGKTNTYAPVFPFSPAAAKPKLLDRVREILRVRHYSLRTEEAYLGWMRRYILFHGKRHPREMGAAEVAAFLNYLANERTVAAATQNQALNACFFSTRSCWSASWGRLRACSGCGGHPSCRWCSRKGRCGRSWEMQGQYRLMAELLYGSGYVCSNVCGCG